MIFYMESNLLYAEHLHVKRKGLFLMDKKTAQHFVEFRNVRKVYKMGEVSIEVLHDVK